MAYGFKTGGRQKGTPNKPRRVDDEVRRAMRQARREMMKAPTEFDSLEQMRIIAKWHLGQASQAQKRVDEEGKPAPDIKTATEQLENAARVLRTICEYEHPKLAQTTLRTDASAPLVTRLEVELVPSRRSVTVVEQSALTTVAN